jgi:hypothetical protein
LDSALLWRAEESGGSVWRGIIGVGHGEAVVTVSEGVAMMKKLMMIMFGGGESVDGDRERIDEDDLTGGCNWRKLVPVGIGC